MSREIETTIKFEVLVTFHYSPSEPITREDPGCDEDCELESVVINAGPNNGNIDILKALTQAQRAKLENECINSLTPDE